MMMANTFYLGSSGTAEVSPSFSSEWDVTSETVRKPITHFPRGSTMTTKSYSDSDTTDQSILMFQFIGAPMRTSSDIATGNLSVNMRGLQTNAGNNMYLAGKARLVDINGDDYDTPKIVAAFTLDSTELDSSTLTSRWLDLGSTTDITVADGDRLVVEVGASGDPDGGQSHSFSLSYGDDSASDLLTTSDSTTTADNPVIDFNTSSMEFYGNLFYLPSGGGTDAPVSPAYSPSWTLTDQVVGRKTLERLPSNSTMTTYDITSTSIDSEDILVMQYVSLPMHPFDSVGLGSEVFDYVIRAKETDTGNNLDVRATVRVVQEDGTDYSPARYLVGPSLLAADTSEVALTLTARSPSTNLLNDNVSIQDGDRLVVEFGMGGNPSGSRNHNGSLSLGDDSETDLPNSNSATAADNPWVELTSALNEYLPFKWPVATGSTTYFETPSVSVAMSQDLARYIKPTKNISAPISPTFSFSNVIGKVLNITMNGAATFARTLTAYINSSSSTGGSNTFDRVGRFPRSFNYTASGSVSSSFGTVIGMAFAAVMGMASSVSTSNIWAVAGNVSASFSSSVSKFAKLTKGVTASVVSTLSQGKLFLESFAVSAGMGVTLVTSNIWTLTLSAVASIASSVSKKVQMTRSVIADHVSSMNKKIIPTAKEMTATVNIEFQEGLKFIHMAMVTCGTAVSVSTSFIAVIGGLIASGWVLSITRKIVSLMTAKFLP